jgi:hypothetical protein
MALLDQSVADGASGVAFAYPGFNLRSRRGSARSRLAASNS